MISTAIMSWSLLVAIEQTTGTGRPSGRTDSALIVLWGFAFAWKVLKSFKAILNRKCLTSFSEHPLQRRWCSDFQEHWMTVSYRHHVVSQVGLTTFLHWTNASSSEMLMDFAWICVVRLPEEFHSSGVFMAQATRHQAKPMVTEFDHNIMGMLIHGFWCFLARPSSIIITRLSQSAIQYDDTVISCGLYVHMRTHSAILLFFFFEFLWDLRLWRRSSSARSQPGQWSRDIHYMWPPIFSTKPIISMAAIYWL